MADNYEAYRKQFIQAILKEELAQDDRDVLSELIARDMNKTVSQIVVPAPSTPIRKLSPRMTSDFLRLFESSEGFKLLTHRYNIVQMHNNGQPDREPHNNSAMSSHASTLFKEKTDNKSGNSIPSTLYALFNGFINGNPRFNEFGFHWQDLNGEKHSFSWNSEDFKAWSVSHEKTHPLDCDDFSNEIKAFKSTTKIDGTLKTIVESITNKLGIDNAELLDLEKATFYTLVPALCNALEKILGQMKDKQNEHPKITVKFERSSIDKKRVAIISIFQEGSFSKGTIDEYVERLDKYLKAPTQVDAGDSQEDGGDFASIYKSLNGYANWSVESKWCDKAIRWNILDDTGKAAIEKITNEQEIKGFKHIITIYR